MSIDAFMMYTISIFFYYKWVFKFNFHKAHLFFIFNLFLYAKNHSVKFIPYCILMSNNFFFWISCYFFFFKSQRTLSEAYLHIYRYIFQDTDFMIRYKKNKTLSQYIFDLMQITNITYMYFISSKNFSCI